MGVSLELRRRCCPETSQSRKRTPVEILLKTEPTRCLARILPYDMRAITLSSNGEVSAPIHKAGSQSKPGVGQLNPWCGISGRNLPSVMPAPAKFLSRHGTAMFASMDALRKLGIRNPTKQLTYPAKRSETEM